MINGSTTPVRVGGDLLAAEVSAANIVTGSANFTCAISNDRLRTYAANPAPAFLIAQKPL